MNIDEIKTARDCWRHCDAFNAHWYDYIKLNMVDYLISENERLRKEKEWLIREFVSEVYSSWAMSTEKSKKEFIIKKMEQALKEK